MLVADTTLRNLVAGEGDTVYRTIVSYPAKATYTPGSDLSFTTVTGSKETLTIGTWSAAAVRIDDTEKRQSIIDLGTNASNKMMRLHNNTLEQAVMSEITNAQWSLDDGNVGGTAGNNMTINTNTVPQVFIAADTKLDAVDAPRNNRIAVVGGHFMAQLKLQQAGRPGSPIADRANANGYVGPLFGYNLIYSNNLPWSATLSIATNPTTGDTITIAGVVFTFNTTIGTTVPGTVKIASSAANTMDNLLAVLNAVDTNIADATDTGYLKVSDENIFLLRDKRAISAVDASGGSDNDLALTVSGFGDIVVSKSLTASADGWSAQKQNALFGSAGCVSLIVQIPPHVEVVRDPKQFADIIKSMVGYGKKTYADGAREMVNVKINAGTSDWV